MTILGKMAGVALLLGAAFGLILLAFVPFEMFKKAEAEGWSSSRKGVITLSSASRKTYHNAPRRHSVSWRAEICGIYKDDGERFCVSRVRYSDFGWEARAREAVAQYPVGREVDVYHSPDDPKETVLEPISPWTRTFALLGIGIGLVLLPVVLWALRKKLEPERHGGPSAR